MPEATHLNVKSKRTAVTLFAGNLDYAAWAIDVLKSLQIYFLSDDNCIQVENIAIPNNGRRHKGYGFITLSWVQEARVDPADICKMCSGRIQVQSRCLYFQELRKDTKEHTKAFHARSGILTGSSGGYYMEG